MITAINYGTIMAHIFLILKTALIYLQSKFYVSNSEQNLGNLNLFCKTILIDIKPRYYFITSLDSLKNYHTNCFSLGPYLKLKCIYTDGFNWKTIQGCREALFQIENFLLRLRLPGNARWLIEVKMYSNINKNGRDRFKIAVRNGL